MSASDGFLRPFDAPEDADGALYPFGPEGAIRPAGIPSGEAFGTPVVTAAAGAQTIYPESIDDSALFGVAARTGGDRDQAAVIERGTPRPGPRRRTERRLITSRTRLAASSGCKVTATAAPPVTRSAASSGVRLRSHATPSVRLQSRATARVAVQLEATVSSAASTADVHRTRRRDAPEVEAQLIEMLLLDVL